MMDGLAGTGWEFCVAMSMLKRNLETVNVTEMLTRRSHSSGRSLLLLEQPFVSAGAN